MSLNGILGAGLTGLQAAQTNLRLVSQNVANVNTTGYARVSASQTAVAGGVAITSIGRAADQFLAASAYNASAAQGKATTLSDLLDRAQTAFGDPTSDGSLFASLDNVFT